VGLLVLEEQETKDAQEDNPMVKLYIRVVGLGIVGMGILYFLMVGRPPVGSCQLMLRV
jgi:hypothetical protein